MVESTSARIYFKGHRNIFHYHIVTNKQQTLLTLLLGHTPECLGLPLKFGNTHLQLIAFALDGLQFFLELGHPVEAALAVASCGHGVELAL